MSAREEGEAYLMLHDCNAAAAEFQNFIDQRGVVVNFPGRSCPVRACPRLCRAGRHHQGHGGLSGFPHSLERRRPRHPHPEASQGRVREAAVARGSHCPLCRNFVGVLHTSIPDQRTADRRAVPWDAPGRAGQWGRVRMPSLRVGMAQTGGSPAHGLLIWALFRTQITHN